MAPRPDLTELGVTGLRRAGGIIDDEIVAFLVGKRGVATYREMSENDPVVGSMLFAIEKVINRLEWQISPASEEPADQEAAAFVQSCLDDMSDSWNATLSSILSMLVYGYSYHEIVYKIRGGPDQQDPARRSRFSDGRIGWRKWPIRSQESLLKWLLDPDGGIQGFVQIDPAGTGQHIIPIEKALLFRTQINKASPEGRSLLRNAFRPWYYKRRIEEIEAVGIERDLAGLPVAEVPPEYLSANATAEQKAVLEAVQTIVTSIKRNEQEGVVFPAVYDDQGHRLFDLKLLSTGGQRQFDTDKIISRYDQRIAMTVLADFILLGHEAVGSYALGVTKVDLWSMGVDAIAKAIAEVVNTHAIPRLLRLNGMTTASMPTLTYGEVGSVNLAELSDFIQKMTAAGVLMPDANLEAYLRQVANLPAATE